MNGRRWLLVGLVVWGCDPERIVMASGDDKTESASADDENATPNDSPDSSPAPPAADAGEAAGATGFDPSPGPGDPGSGGFGHRSRCHSSSDCRGGDYCAKSNCDLGSEGECRGRPGYCQPDSDPHCGCNGVTYWNDCLRQNDGIEFSTGGQCEDNAKPCGGPSELQCPPKIVSTVRCARLFVLPSMCSPDNTGTCWVLPAKCGDQSGASTQWKACSSPDGPPESAGCVDTCNAVLSGSSYVYADGCP